MRRGQLDAPILAAPPNQLAHEQAFAAKMPDGDEHATEGVDRVLCQPAIERGPDPETDELRQLPAPWPTGEGGVEPFLGRLEAPVALGHVGGPEPFSDRRLAQAEELRGLLVECCRTS